jgi:hypothetical protein
VTVGWARGGSQRGGPVTGLAGTDSIGGDSLRGDRKGNPVKKLLLLVLVLAIGAAVAYKVREA